MEFGIIHHNNFYKAGNSEKSISEIDPKYAITGKITRVGCVNSKLLITLEEIKIGTMEDPSHCEVGKYCEPIKFYFDQRTAKENRIPWNGTRDGVEKIRKNLEGKTFILGLGIK